MFLHNFLSKTRLWLAVGGDKARGLLNIFNFQSCGRKPYSNCFIRGRPLIMSIFTSPYKVTTLYASADWLLC